MSAQLASRIGLFARLVSARQIRVFISSPGCFTREMFSVRCGDAVTAFLNGKPIDVVNGVAP